MDVHEYVPDTVMNNRPFSDCAILRSLKTIPVCVKGLSYYNNSPKYPNHLLHTNHKVRWWNQNNKEVDSLYEHW